MTCRRSDSEAWIREVIHARLWMQVIRSGRLHRHDQTRKGWQPDPEIYPGQQYQSPGRPAPDPDADPEEFSGSRRLEGWLHDRGLIDAPDEPNDMSVYEARIAGTQPTLRASLALIAFEENWVAETALRYMLWEGAHFFPAYGENSEHRLDRLPVGWGSHKLPAHFVPLIDAMAAAGFCERLDDGHFAWTDAMASHGAAALPRLWGDGPNEWEQRKWELMHIWRRMPPLVKAKYLRDAGALNPFQLAIDLSAFYDRTSRRWRTTPVEGYNGAYSGPMMTVANELDRVDREDGLPGRSA